MSTKYKIQTLEEIAAWPHKTDSVLVTGCFDILHYGHLQLIEYASELKKGAYTRRPVIIGINSDRAVRLLKGASRPVQPEFVRARMLAALLCVARVFVIDDVKVADAIRRVCPAVWVKGGDYTLESLDDEERETAQSIGVTIEFAPLVPDVSTTKILSQAHWEKK